MSVKPTISCDGQPAGRQWPRCPTSGESIWPRYRTATKLRTYLRRHGWHRTRDGRDICPDCWADGCYRDGIASPRWCTECQCRHPCVCDPDPNPLLLHDEDEDNPWDGDPSTAPDSVKAFLGLAPDYSEGDRS